jgi:hypothetical protein
MCRVRIGVGGWDGMGWIANVDRKRRRERRRAAGRQLMAYLSGSSTAAGDVHLATDHLRGLSVETRSTSCWPA